MPRFRVTGWSAHLDGAEDVDERVALDESRLTPQSGLQDLHLSVAKLVLDLRRRTQEANCWVRENHRSNVAQLAYDADT